MLATPLALRWFPSRLVLGIGGSFGTCHSCNTQRMIERRRERDSHMCTFKILIIGCSLLVCWSGNSLTTQLANFRDAYAIWHLIYDAGRII